MLNPGLERTLFQFPVRPIIVETSGEAFETVTAGIQNLGFGIRVRTPELSMIGILPVSTNVILGLNEIPGVRAIHADSSKNILQFQQFLGPDRIVWPTSDSRTFLEAEQAIQQGFTGEAVVTCVVDTGIDPNHPQLPGAQWDSAMNFPREPGIDAGPQASGHGSHVSTTIGGSLQLTPTGQFVEGVSKSSILSVQALGRVVGTGFSSEIVNAISAGFNRGARIFNLSLGSSECQGGCDICPECRAIKTFSARGAIFVIAAGNSGPSANTINCPGCVSEAITVAAVDRDGLVANFSSRGGSAFLTKPDVAAPGVDIFSGTGRGTQIDLGDIQAGPGFAAISGTSMAAPHVAGLVALLRSRDPGFSAAEFKSRVAVGGLPFSSNLGHGVPKWSMFV